MKRCEDCGYVVKCCAISCERCGGNMEDVKDQPHYWDWQGSILVCERTHRQSIMSPDIMHELPYCPFCMEELPKKGEVSCEGDRPPAARAKGQTTLPLK